MFLPVYVRNLPNLSTVFFLLGGCGPAPGLEGSGKGHLRGDGREAGGVGAGAAQGRGRRGLRAARRRRLLRQDPQGGRHDRGRRHQGARELLRTPEGLSQVLRERNHR